jgi:type IV pilus assembly protein PilV
MTLVELLMALVVLSIGIMSVAALFPTSQAMSTDGRLLTQATDLAQQKLEQLRTLSYSHADLAVGTHPASPELVGNNNRFSRLWTVQQFGAGVTEGKRVDVLVIWQSAQPETVSLVTLFKR